jgi:peroxidase
LYAGGLSEAIVANQTFAVGPTFGCILMEQFAAFKKSDRFYYENGPATTYKSSFTLNQLNQIRNVTLAGLICNNYDLYQIQKTPFLYMDKV